MSQENWITVGLLEDIPQAGARLVKTAFGNIGVFRTSEDQIFALEDRCPHRGGTLSAGIVHAQRVTCPLHNWVIDLGSGEVVGPDEGCVLTLSVRLEGDEIQLDLSALEARATAA